MFKTYLLTKFVKTKATLNMSYYILDIPMKNEKKRKTTSLQTKISGYYLKVALNEPLKSLTSVIHTRAPDKPNPQLQSK